MVTAACSDTWWSTGNISEGSIEDCSFRMRFQKNIHVPDNKNQLQFEADFNYLVWVYLAFKIK